MRTPPSSHARARAISVARPRASSLMPGPRSSAPSLVTRTSVPSGKTVSRWAETTNGASASGRGGLEVRPSAAWATTLPTRSVLTWTSPASAKSSATREPRASSWKGGAGISESSICVASVRSLSARTWRSAAATAGCARSRSSSRRPSSLLVTSMSLTSRRYEPAVAPRDCFLRVTAPLRIPSGVVTPAG